MSKKLKILFIPSWYPSIGDTSGTFVEEQAQALQAAGHDVTIVFSSYVSLGNFLKGKSDRKKYRKSKSIRYVDCETVFFRPGFLMGKTPVDYQRSVIVRRILKRLNRIAIQIGGFDVIHHHGISDLTYITEAVSHHFNIPYVLTEHAPLRNNKIPVFHPFTDKPGIDSFVKNAMVRISVSEHYRRIYEEYFGSSFIVVFNTVGLIFEEELRARELKTYPIKFLQIGALAEHKGQKLLISSFYKAFSADPNFILQLAGVGEDELPLKNLVNSLGLEKQVIFKGYQSRMEIRDLIDASDCLIVSSVYETFAVVVLESFFRGVPVLSVRCGGPEELINDKNGLLCKRNEADFTQALIKMVTLLPHYSPEKIRSEAMKKYGTLQIVKELERIYSTNK